MTSDMERIQDCEDAVENGIAVLEKMSPYNAEVARAMQFLAPKGFRPVVEFRESGRKQRRTASADNWTPANGEILITFEPAGAGDAAVSDEPAKSAKADGDLAEARRFLPVPISGESLSHTILRDRGRR